MAPQAGSLGRSHHSLVPHCSRRSGARSSRKCAHRPIRLFFTFLCCSVERGQEAIVAEPAGISDFDEEYSACLDV